MEVWRDIIDYEGYYQVSSEGRVRSLDRKIKAKNNSLRTKKGAIKKCAISGGYRLCLLAKHNYTKGVSVHRLVAIAFISNPNNKPEVNHIDGNKLNNSLCNLEWCTRQENAQHAQDNNLQTAKRGEKSHFAKLTNLQILDIFSLSRNGVSAKEITNMYPVCYSSICRILRKETYIDTQLIPDGLAIDKTTI